MPLVLFKQVKANKMKEDAFRLAFLSMLHKVEREVKKDFQATVATWEKKPKFESAISLIGGPAVMVGTDDKVYRFMNDGTEEHDIPKEPKTDGFLRYQVGYKAKTTPGLLTSEAGGKFGPWVKRRQVHHPGTEARDFERYIKERWDSKYMKMAQDAMKEGAKNSGHGVK